MRVGRKTEQASFVSCLAIRHSADGCPVSTGQIYLKTRQVSIPTADALAVLGHAADARGVKNCR